MRHAHICNDDPGDQRHSWIDGAPAPYESKEYDEKTGLKKNPKGEQGRPLTLIKQEIEQQKEGIGRQAEVIEGAQAVSRERLSPRIVG
jgi:hypothetical protein